MNEGLPLTWVRPLVAALVLAGCAGSESQGFCTTAYAIGGVTVDVEGLPDAEQVCLDSVCLPVIDQAAVFQLAWPEPAPSHDKATAKVEADDLSLDRELKVVGLVIRGIDDAVLVSADDVRLPLYATNGFECEDGVPAGTITAHKDGSITVSEDRESPGLGGSHRRDGI